MRIVLDTNVAVSALLWSGTPYRLLEAIRQRESSQLFTSTALIEELTEVLLRPMLAKRLALVGHSARELVSTYIDAAHFVTPLAVPSVVAADPDDDCVLALGVAVRADLIVSGDRHLLVIGTYRTSRIVTPAEALQLMIAQ